MTATTGQRCTYCRQWKLLSAFTPEGDHVIPASLGGAWIDYRVCRECNVRANDVADKLIGRDFLVRFMRSLYGIPDRYGNAPPPPVFAVRLSGGVVNVTLQENGPTFEAEVSPALAAELRLHDPSDQERLRGIVTDALQKQSAESGSESLAVARIAQQLITPPEAWSRFMAKLGLACGREAYGDSWLFSRQARILSRDLLGDDPPRFDQRWHHPPVERAWPYEPPKHQLWIEPFKDTAILFVVLFGQVHGGVPVNDLPSEGHPTAWSLDPRARTMYRTGWPAIWLGNAARRIEEKGGTPVLIAHPDHPFIYTPHGPDGPIVLGVATETVNSPAEAFELVRRWNQERDE
jgi:hypothetical protein